MRRTFVETLSELARKDDKIILIIADVGFSFIEDYAKEFPKQFINVGVTEQSMMGLAAGLALSGWRPYVYSMIPFVTFRCLEQLRNDVCYNNAPVKVIGVKGSVHYKFLGFSHNIVPNEDMQALALLPNIKLFEPQTTDDVKDIMNKWHQPPFDGPSYMRI